MADIVQFAYITSWLVLFTYLLRYYWHVFPVFTVAVAITAAQSLIMLTGNPTDDVWCAKVWWPSRIALCAFTAAAGGECAYIFTALLRPWRRAWARGLATGVCIFLLLGVDHFFTNGVWIALTAGMLVILITSFRYVDSEMLWAHGILLSMLLLAHALVASIPRSTVHWWYGPQALFRYACIVCCWCWITRPYRALSRARPVYPVCG